MKEDEGYRPGWIARGDVDALHKLERTLELALQPAPREHIEGLLAEVDAITVSKAKSEIDIVLQITGLVDRLECYPADVVQNVLRNWNVHWFPSWGQLKERLDRAVTPRKAMLVRVREGLRRPPVAQIEEPRTTEEQRADTQRKLNYFVQLARTGAGSVPPAKPTA